MQKELWGWKKWIYFRDAMLLLLLPGLTDEERTDFFGLLLFRVRRRLGVGGPTFKGKRRRSSLFADDRHKNPPETEGRNKG